MWKFGVLIAFASVILLNAGAQGGVIGISIPGYLPGENVRAPAPEADKNPNDIYSHLPVRGPVNAEDLIVLYPRSIFGLENSQDPERPVYQTFLPGELDALQHSSFDQHGKAHSDHHHDHPAEKTVRSIQEPDQSLSSEESLDSALPYPYVYRR